MSVFMVCLSDGPLAELADRIKSNYPDRFKLSQRVYLVRSNSISDYVAQNVGVKGPDRIDESTGIVFKLGPAYAGFHSRSVWEWLSLGERADA